MKAMFWLAVLVSGAVAVFLVRYLLRKHADRERDAEARAAQFLAQMAGVKRPAAAPPATVPSSVETQKLLFDAARKAGEAGEPELAIQLYARLLKRFPDSGFASEVRAAVEAQKRLIKA